MWKIVAILLLTVTVMLLARLVYKAPMVQTRVGERGIELLVRCGNAHHATLRVCRHQGMRLSGQ